MQSSHPSRIHVLLIFVASVLMISVTLGPRSAQASNGMATIRYIVRPADTLSGIALSFGTTVNALLTTNGLTSADQIQTGQVLLVSVSTTQQASQQSQSANNTPAYGNGQSNPNQANSINQGNGSGQNYRGYGGTQGYGDRDHDQGRWGRHRSSTAQGSGGTTSSSGQASSQSYAGPAVLGYIVRAGDTLSAIALRFGVSLVTLARINNLSTQAPLLIGQRLILPFSTGSAGSQATLSVPAITQQGTSNAPAPYASGGSNGTTAQAPTASTEKAAPGTVEALLTSQAQAAGISVSLVKAVAWQESGWRMVIAADGGIGVMQLMPYTANWISNTLLGYAINPYTVTDNVHAGVTLLAYYLRLLGNVSLAVAAYHQGLASVQRQGITAEGQRYVSSVLALQQRFAATSTS